MVEGLYPATIVCLLFFIYWIVKYPSIVHDVLVFTDRSNSDVIMSITLWIYLIMSISCIIITAQKIL